MSVVARFSVMADGLPLADALDVAPGTRLRLGTMIPTGEAAAPYVELSSPAPGAVVEELAAAAIVEDVAVVDELEDHWLLRVRWTDGLDGLFDLLTDASAVVLDGEARGDRWSFRARFPEHADLAGFYRACSAAGLPLEVDEVHGAGNSVGGVSLTPGQREALVTALEAGYFDVPRAITLQELGERLDISDTAASQRIRRGLDRLLRGSVLDPLADVAGRSEPD